MERTENSEQQDVKMCFKLLACLLIFLSNNQLFFFSYCAFSHLMFIEKPLTAERRNLSERDVLSLENAEKAAPYTDS